MAGQRSVFVEFFGEHPSSSKRHRIKNNLSFAYNDENFVQLIPERRTKALGDAIAEINRRRDERQENSAETSTAVGGKKKKTKKTKTKVVQKDALEVNDPANPAEPENPEEKENEEIVAPKSDIFIKSVQFKLFYYGKLIQEDRKDVYNPKLDSVLSSLNQIQEILPDVSKLMLLKYPLAVSQVQSMRTLKVNQELPKKRLKEMNEICAKIYDVSCEIMKRFVVSLIFDIFWGIQKRRRNPNFCLVELTNFSSLSLLSFAGNHWNSG